MLTKEQLEKAIGDLPGEKVTSDYMKSRISDVIYNHPTETLTICIIVLDNGYNTVGQSACVDPINYRKEIGEDIAYKSAFDKLWPLFGFLLAEKRYVEKEFPDTPSTPDIDNI